MPRTIKVAAVQMDASPAPKIDRLERAETFIAEAASAGAQLVVLPELFNSGYEYHDDNYTLPEPIDGETVQWMKTQAAKFNVHLAGSLLLLDGKDVYNSQIIMAPDGRRWRYNKNYPYAFERAYFKDGSDIMIADTDLGRLGMMICWDYTHPELWQRYAGQVDMIVMTSSPPTENKFKLILPNGERIDSRHLGPIVRNAYHGADEPFGADLDAQAGWLGVPLVNTTASGTFRSYLPNPRIPFVAYTLFRPDLWKHFNRAEKVEIEKGFYYQTKIVGGDGRVRAHLEDPEGFIMDEIDLPDETPPKPSTPQPAIPISNATYFLADVIGPAVMESAYREGVRGAWGKRMAPRRQSVRWIPVIAIGLLAMLAAIVRGLGNLTSGGKRGS